MAALFVGRRVGRNTLFHSEGSYLECLAGPDKPELASKNAIGIFLATCRGKNALVSLLGPVLRIGGLLGTNGACSYEVQKPTNIFGKHWTTTSLCV